MPRLSLKMLSIGSLLLIFNDHRSSAAPSPSSHPASDCSRCVTEARFLRRVRRLQERWENLVPLGTPAPNNMTCSQAAKEMRGDVNNRSVSPWTYRKVLYNETFPHEIQVAECLCRGCIIKDREDHSYNSVPVFGERMVLKRTRCQSDKNKYMVEKDFLKIPVGCTCVVPNTT